MRNDRAERAVSRTEDKDKKLVSFVVEEEDSRTAISEDNDFSENVH